MAVRVMVAQPPIRECEIGGWIGSGGAAPGGTGAGSANTTNVLPRARPQFPRQANVKTVAVAAEPVLPARYCRPSPA